MPPRNGSQPSVAAANPTIVLSGEENSSLTAGLLNLQIIETLDGLYRCEASIGNWGEASGSTGYLYFDRQPLDFGKPWQIRLGSTGDARTIFNGRITALEAQYPTGRQPYITVLAEDRFQDLRMTRRTRSFTDISDLDLFQQIASDHSLQTDLAIDGPTHRVLAQVNQSDLAFMRERARLLDAELWMDGDTLHAAARSRRDGETVSFFYPGSLRELSVLADLSHQRTSLTVSGWDIIAKQALSSRAGESAISSELNGGDSGASVLQQALGERQEMVVHQVPISGDESQSMADSLFRRMARRFVTGRGLTEPDPNLRVGATVDLDGLGPLFNGRYYLREVRFLFDRLYGARTEILVERSGLGRLA